MKNLNSNLKSSYNCWISIFKKNHEFDPFVFNSVTTASELFDDRKIKFFDHSILLTLTLACSIFQDHPSFWTSKFGEKFGVGFENNFLRQEIIFKNFNFIFTHLNEIKIFENNFLPRKKIVLEKPTSYSSQNLEVQNDRGFSVRKIKCQ